jgi:hypothetical protein
MSPRKKSSTQRMRMKKIAWGSNAGSDRGVANAPPHFIISPQPHDASSCAAMQTIITPILSRLISTMRMAPRSHIDYIIARIG